MIYIHRAGHGRLDLADGTTIVGNFSKTLQYTPNSTNSNLETKNENPYMEGEPDGPVEVLFGDGGFYKGVLLYFIGNVDVILISAIENIVIIVLIIFIDECANKDIFMYANIKIFIIFY